MTQQPNKKTILLLPLALAVGACSTGVDPEDSVGQSTDSGADGGWLCTPGDQLACTCLDGSAGEQPCLPTGYEIGACVCPGLDALEIAGQWLDNWGSNHEIDEMTWRSGSSRYHVDVYNNDGGWMVARNDSDNEFNPDLWSRFEWTTDEDDDFWYCQVLFDGTTKADAKNATSADPTDPANGGCGGFSWTRLDPSPGPELMGTYDDDFGGLHIIDAGQWSIDYGIPDLFHFEAYSNIDDWVVAQNGSANAFNPDKYSRFDWVVDSDDGDDGLWYCQVVFDADSAGDAGAASPADSTDPASMGCGGFAWTRLTPRP